MTESPGNEPGSTLFARIQQMVSERGVDISQNLNGNALKLEFADGQRILINLDAQTHNVWLAARSGGVEFVHHDGTWRARDQSELFAKLREIIDQTISSNPLNACAPGAKVQQAVRPEPVIFYEAKESHGLRNALIVMLAGIIGFWAAQKVNKPLTSPATDSPRQTQTLSLNKLNPQCEGGFPVNGSITIFPESGLRTDGPNDPEVTFKNDHSHPVLLILSAPRLPTLSYLPHGFCKYRIGGYFEE